MTVKTKLKIYLLGKNNFVRQGLIELVQRFSRINKIEGIESKKQLVELISISKPDLVIIDFDVQLIDGFEICEYIISHSIESKILVISQYEDEDTIIKLMEMGVHGYLLKNTSPAELEKALYSICDNDIYRNDLVVNVLLNNRAKKKLSSSKELTSREEEVIKLLCLGYNPKETAEKLFLSEKTVQNYRTMILGKLKIKNFALLIKWAIEKGLVHWEKSNFV